MQKDVSPHNLHEPPQDICEVLLCHGVCVRKYAFEIMQSIKFIEMVFCLLCFNNLLKARLQSLVADICSVPKEFCR